MWNLNTLRGDRRELTYNNATECIGNTPLVYINKITKDLPAKIGLII